MKLYVTLNEDGLFCIAREFRGETERMATDRDHLKAELAEMGADRVCYYQEENMREYELREL